MPAARKYAEKMELLLKATVVDARDSGGIVLDIGGGTLAIERTQLDRADVSPGAERDETDEERDRREIEEHEARERRERQGRERAERTEHFRREGQGRSRSPSG